MRILVVDDNPDALRTLGALLALEAHHVTLAGTAGLALRALVAKQFDVVLLDIRMPGLSGFEVADRIRAMPLAPQPVIIAVSGDNTLTAEKLKAHGIDLLMLKPCSIDTLLATPRVREADPSGRRRRPYAPLEAGVCVSDAAGGRQSCAMSNSGETPAAAGTPALLASPAKTSGHGDSSKLHD